MNDVFRQLWDLIHTNIFYPLCWNMFFKYRNGCQIRYTSTETMTCLWWCWDLKGQGKFFLQAQYERLQDECCWMLSLGCHVYIEAFFSFPGRTRNVNSLPGRIKVFPGSGVLNFALSSSYYWTSILILTMRGKGIDQP